MNKYYIIIIIILCIIIFRKIYKLNKPFDKDKFIKQQKNQKKLKKNISLDVLKNNISNITSYYVGI